MFECLILGDSIGLGAAKAINERYARHCDVQAVERATAAQILSWRKLDKSYGSCVFAMGSNDAPVRLLRERSPAYAAASASAV